MTERPSSNRIRVPHAAHWGAFYAIVEDGTLVGIEPFEHDPVPSPILGSVLDAPYADCRIQRPSIRRGWLENGPIGGAVRGAEDFVDVPWDEALDRVAAELARVRAKFGNDSIFGGSYGWSSAGRFHHAKTQLQRFLGCIGGFTNAVNNYSLAAAMAVLPHILGSYQACAGPVTSWDSIIRSSRFVIAFGGLAFKNLQITPGGPGAHECPPMIAAARRAGVRFVNISPNRSDMDPSADAEWIPIRPNTDTALMLAMCHVLLEENRADIDFLETYCVGSDRVVAYLRGEVDGQAKTPEWAAEITGVPAETCRRLAREAASCRTMVTTAWSLQRADHGEQPFWATVALAAFLGQIGLPGGGLAFGHGSMGGLGTPRRPIRPPDFPKGPNPIETAIPVARIADMLLDPNGTYAFNGKTCTFPDIRLVYWCGGNPFHHHQDLNRFVEAFRRPETIIVHDSWWTPTARMADIVLPATTTLERDDIGASDRDRFILAMKKAIEPVGDARNDHAVFRDLARRFGAEDAFTEGLTEAEWIRRIYETARESAKTKGVDVPPFDVFWDRGYAEIPAPSEPFDLYADFRADPEGAPLATPSGKIELFSERVNGFGYAECPGFPAWLEPCEWLGSPLAETYPIHLISNQPKARLHSQLDFGRASLADKIDGLEPLVLNPVDADARGIANGEKVRVFNGRGTTHAAARVSNDVMPGVAVLATGAWYRPTEWGRAGAPELNGNPNVLTPDIGTSRLGQGPIAHSTLVEIEPADTDFSRQDT